MAEAARETKPGLEIATTRWPIVELRIHPHFSISDIDTAYDQLEEIARRKEPHIHWTDLREVHPLWFPSTVRKHFAERERRMHEIAKDYIVADVRIVNQRLVRGILAAFEWLTGEAPWPVRTVATEEEAEAWLRSLNILGGS